MDDIKQWKARQEELRRNMIDLGMYLDQYFGRAYGAEIAPINGTGNIHKLACAGDDIALKFSEGATLSEPTIRYVHGICDKFALYTATSGTFRGAHYDELRGIYVGIRELFEGHKEELSEPHVGIRSQHTITLDLLERGQTVFPYHVWRPRKGLRALQEESIDTGDLPERRDAVEEQYWNIFREHKAAWPK